MKTKYSALLLIVFGLCAGFRALSQEPDKTVPENMTVVQVGTNGYVRANGRYWIGLSLRSKICLLYGYEEGMTLLAREASVKAKPDVAAKTQELAGSLMVTGFRFSDLVKQVDEVYGDSANVRIPVIEAYVFVLHKVRGDTKDELERAIVALRREYNN